MQATERSTSRNKYANILALPSSFLKILSSRSSLRDTEQENVICNQKNNTSNDGDVLSEALMTLINDIESIFENDRAFGTVRKLATNITNTSEANHVIFVLTEVVNCLSNNFSIDKQTELYTIPLELLDNFNFPESYKKQCEHLKEQCKNIRNLPECKRNLQNIISLIGNVYANSVAQNKELEKFILNVGIQISRIGDELHSTVEKQVSDLEIHNDLNAKMKSTVNDISENIISSNDLSILKSTVKAQLDSLQVLVEEERQVVMKQETHINENVKALINEVNELKLETQELRQRVQVEKENALRDSLTGLYNREAFENELKNLISRAETNDRVASLLVWDIDHFKKFNDTYGHMIGDKVLRVVTKKLSQALQKDHFAARYGGEEFVTILPGVTEDEALPYAEKIRDEISRITYLFKGKPLKVTVSCGISAMRENDNAKDLFERADKALYEAKKSGRNCVKLYLDNQSS